MSFVLSVILQSFAVLSQKSIQQPPPHLHLYPRPQLISSCSLLPDPIEHHPAQVSALTHTHTDQYHLTSRLLFLIFLPSDYLTVSCSSLILCLLIFSFLIPQRFPFLPLHLSLFPSHLSFLHLISSSSIILPFFLGLKSVFLPVELVP